MSTNRLLPSQFRLIRFFFPYGFRFVRWLISGCVLRFFHSTPLATEPRWIRTVSELPNGRGEENSDGSRALNGEKYLRKT